MVVGKFGFYTAGPNTALVTSSGKIAIAGRLFALPIIHRVDSLSLKLRTITVHTNHGTTVNGVAVHVTGCCQVKIHGWSTVPGPHGEEMAIDHDAIRLAAQHFLGHSDAHIADAIQKTVEGHQRAIIGTLTIEQLYSDRSAFSHQVKELCVQDMRNMGLSMVSYTVAEISDDEGYINALGTTQTEKVKRAATEGFAMHRSNALAKSREMEAHSHLKINQQRELMIQSHKELQIHRASAQTTINQAEANQQKAYAIEIAKENAVLHVAKRDAEAAKAEAERVVEAINVQKAKLHNEIRKNIPANAALYRKEREAEAIRAKSAADADRLRMISEAQAYSIRLKGAAKTKALEERVRMWNECANTGAVMEKLIQTLPEVAAKIAEPLAKTEKLVFIGGRDDESEKKPEISEPSEGEREPAPAVPPMDFDAVVRHMMTRGDGGHLAALMKDHMSGSNSADRATNTSTSEPK